MVVLFVAVVVVLFVAVVVLFVAVVVVCVGDGKVEGMMVGSVSVSIGVMVMSMSRTSADVVVGEVGVAGTMIVSVLVLV